MYITIQLPPTFFTIVSYTSLGTLRSSGKGILSVSEAWLKTKGERAFIVRAQSALELSAQGGSGQVRQGSLLNPFLKHAFIREALLILLF